MAARHCPYCEHQFEAGSDFEGYIVACPNCNERIVVRPPSNDAGKVSQPDERAVRRAVPAGNELAQVSLALGIASFLCVGPLLSIPGLITGYMALDKSVRTHDTGAKWIAIFALLLNGLNLVCSGLFLPTMWFP